MRMCKAVYYSFCSHCYAPFLHLCSHTHTCTSKWPCFHHIIYITWNSIRLKHRSRVDNLGIIVTKSDVYIFFKFTHLKIFVSVLDSVKRKLFPSCTSQEVWSNYKCSFKSLNHCFLYVVSHKCKNIYIYPVKM